MQITHKQYRPTSSSSASSTTNPNNTISTNPIDITTYTTRPHHTVSPHVPNISNRTNMRWWLLGWRWWLLLLLMLLLTNPMNPNTSIPTLLLKLIHLTRPLP
ncbi:hypothetical protein TorRG33x02_100580 [Trema orientale]|uniref:Uncharacterized protein n=1 Tax=Trema orientale TaxID=63057 RepID=A0A2P5F8C5_TREOI|nr:hypothetical protein TorRG33x02_100580 [Trema orientale]